MDIDLQIEFCLLGYMMVNYLDDFGGAETNEKAWKAYETLGELLMSCGLEESVDKAVTPLPLFFKIPTKSSIFGYVTSGFSPK
jgi:hypothetical protein